MLPDGLEPSTYSIECNGQRSGNRPDARENSPGNPPAEARTSAEPDHGHRNGSVIRFPRCKRCGETRPEAFAERTRGGRRCWQAYCRPCQVEYHREWRASAEGREKMRAGNKASKARHPERNRARNALAYALRLGTIVRGECYARGADCSGGIEAHHDDYTRPLDVTWTCRRHHRALDRARRVAATREVAA